MDYYESFSTVGAGVGIAGMVLEQTWLFGIVLAIVGMAALLLRLAWRRDMQISD
ncbi:hypothetical protein [Sinosporangium siamense]|uniref:Uncharacterized protein n=1 Tax=Sinosporangium siamense TaxID=1367973 RepID=A0A919V8D3_9ACTN|nr:hypothetical protein [Sinosporangium siamense]GII96030.1 hypothetical protein Ssi02_62610 [Sinosporangium siamense]